MKILVTGGAGFIGGNLDRMLIERGDEVVAFDDLSTGRVANLQCHERLTFVDASILDARALDDACVGVDAIVHLAAKASVPESVADPLASHLVNVAGTIQVLEAARRAGNPQVVLASSSSVYGDGPEAAKHERLPLAPMSPYAASKAALEAYAASYHRSYGLPVLVFRFFNVFGPLQHADHVYAAVIPAFVAAALAGRPITVHGDGRQTRDFTDVATVARVICTGIDRAVVSPDPVNLAFGSRTDLLHVIDTLQEIVGSPLEVEHTAPRDADIRHSSADSTRFRELFPDVTATPLDDSLRATVEWFRSTQPQLPADVATADR